MSIYDVNGNAVALAYNKNGDAIQTAYDVNGNAIAIYSDLYDYDNYTVTEDFSVSTSSYSSDGTQGMAAYNGTLFQFQTNGSNIENVASVIDLENKTFVRNITVQANHGNAAQFSGEFYAANDDFPILYVSSYNTDNNYIYLNRVTQNNSTLIKTYNLPISSAGYRVNAVPSFDEDDVLWSIGHTKNSTTDGTDNDLIVCKWDTADAENEGGGVYKPTLLSTFTIPFIYAIQDTKFFDHKLFVSSGYPSTPQYLTLIDPYMQAVKEVVTLNGTDETEGIEFVADGNGGFYMLLNTIHTGKYYKYVFAST